MSAIFKNNYYYLIMADDDEDRLSSESSPSPLNPRRAKVRFTLKI